MGKLFLLVFNYEINRDELTKFFDLRSEIIFWFYNLPNSIFIRSNLGSKELSELVESKTGFKNHIVVEVAGFWGRLPQEHWKYFK